MTEEQRDAQYGRVARELKAAETELNHELVRAASIVSKLENLAAAVTERIAVARNAGETIRGITIADAGVEDVDLYAEVANVQTIKNLDDAIGRAVGKVMALREQKQQLEP